VDNDERHVAVNQEKTQGDEMISLSQITVSGTAPANTTIGTLSLLDYTGTSRLASWALTEGSAGNFGISGANLVTQRASIPAGFYGVKVRGNAENVALKEKARFVIQVM
jgi:hypothetical protein